MDSIDPNDASSIRLSQEAFGNSSIMQNLAYIKCNFSVIPSAIKKLETQGLSLADSLDVIGEVKTQIYRAKGDVGQAVKNKLNKVLMNNPGLEKLVNILKNSKILVHSKFSFKIDVAKLLTGGEAELRMTPNILAAYKFAPLSSVDIERSFSIYKNILNDNRTNFTPENIEKYIICNIEKRE